MNNLLLKHYPKILAIKTVAHILIAIAAFTDKTQQYSLSRKLEGYMLTDTTNARQQKRAAGYLIYFLCKLRRRKSPEKW